MKLALEGPTIRFPRGISPALRREWIKALTIPKNCVTVEQMIDNIEKEHPGFRDELEAAKQEMKRDGSWEQLMNPANWVIEPVVLRQPCVVERYLKDLNPTLKGAPLYISCTCPRCSPSM